MSFSISDSGTFTVAARNTETVPRVIPYKERRRLEKQRKLNAEIEKQRQDALKAKKKVT